MKSKLISSLLLTFFVLAACQSRFDAGIWSDKLDAAIISGEFSQLIQMADTLRQMGIKDQTLLAKADSLVEMSRRIPLDFSLSEADILKRLSDAGITFTSEERDEWERLNWLEYRMIEGERRYFNRSVSNLQRMLKHQEALPKDSPDYEPDDFQRFKLAKAKAIISASASGAKPVEPVSMKLRLTLTVKPDVVPDGEIIRCWLPYPAEQQDRQQEVTLLSASPSGYLVSQDASAHHSVFFEQKAEAGKATVFSVEFSYVSYGQWFDPAVMRVNSYDKAGKLYEQFTAEEPPHILFTDKIRELSAEVVGEEKNPVEVTRRLFHWMDANIPWAGALEYSIIPQIPEYVMNNRRGDCGMKTLLLMSLLRYNGIPVRWQSGWMLHPGEVNLHDWCEVYYEGTGWVPLDMSFGLLPSADQREREFYLTGMDPYRLIVNEAIAAPFYPAKSHFRSEPYDFQRGEVEWKGGNLYFDKWRYKMDVEYLNE